MDYILKAGVITDTRHTEPDLSENVYPKQQAHNSWGPNWYQVRILPDMNDIQDKDENNDLILPWYPNFFSENNTAYQPGDLVWIVCDDDYHVGFILGLAQAPTGDNIKNAIFMFNQAEVNAGYPQSEYRHISVTKMSDTSLTFNNRETGISGQIFNSRIIYIYGNDGSIFSTNGNGYTLVISALGDITINGNSIGMNSKNEHTLQATSSYEKVTSKYIDSSGMVSINASGAYECTTASNSSSRTMGDSDVLVGKTKKETVGLGSSRIVSLGALKETVGAGSYTLTVGVGTITLCCSLPMILSSTTSISMLTPILNLASCDSIILPLVPGVGFQSGAGPASVPIPIMPGLGLGIGASAATLATNVASSLVP